jgi:hypothetical protein
MILDLSAAPADPVERVMWLSGVKAQVTRELDAAFASAYFHARLQGRLEPAVTAGPYSRKRVLAYTRHENRRTGTTVRWGDGLDPTSTAYPK